LLLLKVSSFNVILNFDNKDESPEKYDSPLGLPL
jgi:hypothetical protein